MKNLQCLSLRTTNDCLEVLDQRLLPHQETWISTRNVDDMIAAIQGLALRGAPAIGVGAALALGQSALQGTTKEQLVIESKKLRAARPTAVNLMTCLDRMDEVLRTDFSAAKLAAKAEELFREDVELCDRIAHFGAPLIADGETILTHCNTGGLATAGRGTAFGILQAAQEAGKKIHVFVDETRPLLQGARLTAWECARQKIPYTLISDNMAAYQMSLGRIHKVFVGSDRIARNGDFANKIGTYSLAVLCHYHRIPFYVAAPKTTVDTNCPSGLEIPIEQRSADEVRGHKGSSGEVSWAPRNCPVDNPAFDVTPASLVTGWILDTGLYNREDIRNGLHLTGA